VVRAGCVRALAAKPAAGEARPWKQDLAEAAWPGVTRVEVLETSRRGKPPPPPVHSSGCRSFGRVGAPETECALSRDDSAGYEQHAWSSGSLCDQTKPPGGILCLPHRRGRRKGNAEALPTQRRCLVRPLAGRAFLRETGTLRAGAAREGRGAFGGGIFWEYFGPGTTWGRGGAKRISRPQHRRTAPFTKCGLSGPATTPRLRVMLLAPGRPGMPRTE